MSEEYEEQKKFVHSSLAMRVVVHMEKECMLKYTQKQQHLDIVLGFT